MVHLTSRCELEKKEDANEKKLSDKQRKNLSDLSYAGMVTFQTVEIRKKMIFL